MSRRAGSSLIGSYVRSLRLFQRDARLYLGATAIIGFAGSSGIYGVLLSLYLLRLGYGAEFIGWVGAMGPLSSSAFSLPASVVGRRWGLRPSMIVGVLLIAAGSGLLPVSEYAPLAVREEWILGAYLLGGVGRALYGVNHTPALMGVTTARERNHAFSVRVAMMPFAGFAGSLIGGLLPGAFARVLGVPLDDPETYRLSLWVAALLLCLAVWVLWITQTPGVDQTRSGDQASATGLAEIQGRAGSLAPIGLVLLLSTVSFLRVAGEQGPRTFFSLYLDDALGLATAQIGALIGVGRLLAIPAALVAPIVIARWGTERTVVRGALGVAVGLMPLALIPRWYAAGFGLMMMTAMASISRSAFVIYSQQVFSRHWRVTISAATTMAAGLSGALIAFFGGYLVSSAGYSGLFLVGAALTTAGAALFWIGFCVPGARHMDRSSADKVTRAESEGK